MNKGGCSLTWDLTRRYLLDSGQSRGAALRSVAREAQKRDSAYWPKAVASRWVVI